MRSLKIVLFWAAILSLREAFCQNLVVNPSFEEFTACPGIHDGVHYLDGWHELTSEGSLNVLTTCAETSPSNYFGFQHSRSGNSYLHIGSTKFVYPRNFVDTDSQGDFFWREVALGTLTEPLQEATYYFSTYISLANPRQESLMNCYYTSAFDLALFDSLPNNTPFHAQPPYVQNSQVVWMNPSSNIITDSIKWVRIGGCFEAKGGEKYFAIGTFRDTSQIILQPNLIYNQNGYSSWTSYFYDDVQIVACPDCACVETLPDPDPEPSPTAILTIGNNPGSAGKPVTFQMNFGEEKSWQLKLYDYAGRLVYDYGEESGSIDHALPESLAKAVYHFVLEVEGMDAIGGKVITGVE